MDGMGHSRHADRERQRVSRELEGLHLNQPWLWKREWAASRIEDENRNSCGFLLLAQFGLPVLRTQEGHTPLTPEELSRFG